MFSFYFYIELILISFFKQLWNGPLNEQQQQQQEQPQPGPFNSVRFYLKRISFVTYLCTYKFYKINQSNIIIRQNRERLAQKPCTNPKKFAVRKMTLNGTLDILNTTVHSILQITAWLWMERKKFQRSILTNRESPMRKVVETKF
jgi:hypothetical protein